MKHSLLLFAVALPLISACSKDPDVEKPGRPLDSDRQRKVDRGKLTGEGWTILGGDDSKDKGGASPIGVSGYLWRATLDTLSFMPFLSEDPFGGVVLTDWYEDPKTPGERFKINALILGKSLRSDGIRITLFKQRRSETGWADAAVDPKIATQIEDTILTRARELRVNDETK